MATIVEQIGTGHRYLLLGAGYGKFQSSRPNAFFGDILPTTKEGSEAVLAVCNEEGRIGWVRSEEVRVVSVDGVEPAEALA
jgi:hypothetical protein